MLKIIQTGTGNKILVIQTDLERFLYLFTVLSTCSFTQEFLFYALLLCSKEDKLQCSNHNKQLSKISSHKLSLSKSTKFLINNHLSISNKINRKTCNSNYCQITSNSIIKVTNSNISHKIMRLLLNNIVQVPTKINNFA